MMIGIIGLPRSGKSTYLAKLAKKYIKKGENVFSNFYIKGCYKFDFNDLGKKDFHDCVILIDEISLFADCRNFKEFNKDLVYFFTNYGHYNVKIYYCSQSLSADKKIRDLTDELYRIKPLFWHISYIRRIIKDLDNDTLTDIYRPTGFPRLLFRNFYYSMFDSFCRKSLPPVRLIPWSSQCSACASASSSVLLRLKNKLKSNKTESTNKNTLFDQKHVQNPEQKGIRRTGKTPPRQKESP